MKCRLLILLCLLGISVHAQNWAGILSPTHGAGACALAPSGTYAGCGIDWTQVGVPGGIPAGTQSGATIQASACGNGTTDCTSTIQTALRSCDGSAGNEKFVQLGAGTFLYSGAITVPSYCYLNGEGDTFEDQRIRLRLCGYSFGGMPR